MMKVTRLLGATALVGSLMAVPSIANAQVTVISTAAPQDQSAGDDTTKDDSTITVTGSRIRRSKMTGADPVTVITNEERTEAGFNSSTQLLQSTAVTNGTSQINNAYGGFVTNGGPGANTLSLRGLGTSRTLILLNGRRLAPSGSRGAVGSADLNSLPTAMVDRIEVLNSGASSVYGSDAVAGVINVITRNHINGIELSAQVNVPERGAGVQTRLAAVFGFESGDFTLNGSAEYYNRNTFTFGDADFTQCATDYRRAPGSSVNDSGDYIDPRTGQPKCYGIAGGTGAGGVTINTLGTPNFAGNTVQLAPGVPAGYGTLPTSAGFGTTAQQVCNRFRANPTAGGALPGYECVGGGFLSTDIRDTYAPQLLNDALISPTTNYNGFLSGTYQLHMLGNAEIYAEVMASRRDSAQLSNRQFTIDYNQGSLLLPVNLRSGTLTAYSAANTPTAPAGTPVAARVFGNYGNYNNYQTSDFVKFSGGIRGDLPANWHYDFFASKSWADASYTTDLILTNRLAQSLDVVASGTGFACRNATIGCVAAPALSADVINGNYPSDWLKFVIAPVTGKTKFRETVFNFTVDGPLFALPGGDVQVAIGVEQRTQSIDDSPSPESTTGNLYGFTSSSPTRGSDQVREIFGEIQLPILHDSFIYDLTLNASGRYTDYRSFGGQTTYKVGGELSIIPELKFRGSYGTSYRAPQLFEQYLGSTTGFNNATTDICNNLTAASPAIRRTNCAADGIGLGFNQTSSVTVKQRGGAESGLKAETSRNINAGVVLQPKIGPVELSFAVDYFDVKVDNGVSQLSSATIQSQCYDSPEFRANSICNYVQRGPAPIYALSVTTGYVNISTSVVRGIDYTARIALPVGPGKLRFDGSVTQFIKRYTLGLPTDPVVNLVGVLANPKFTGTFGAAYVYDRFTLHYGAEWIQHMDSQDYVGADATYVFYTPDVVYHNLSVNWRGDNFQFGVGVRNLTDKQPPFISSGAYNRIGNTLLYSGFDYVGREFFMNVTTKF